MGEDFGLALERTALAWQRTALAVAAGAAIVGRLTFDRVGLLAVVAFAAALLLSAWILAQSRLLYHCRAVRRAVPRAPSFIALGLSVAVTALAATHIVAIVTS